MISFTGRGCGNVRTAENIHSFYSQRPRKQTKEKEKVKDKAKK
jgi:hypothetical protein